MSDSFFKQKWVVITGAAHGIGQELSRQLAEQGANLLLSDIDTKTLVEWSEKLRESHRDIQVFEWGIDVSKRSEMEGWIEEVQKITPVVDVLFNNAGISVAASFSGHEWDDWEKVIGVNVWGVIYGCRLFLPLLQNSSRGQIVNMSSLFGIIGMPNQVAYCVSKYAVRGLSEALWEELEGVAVTVVHPGGIRTQIVERGKSTSDEYQSHIVDFFRTKTMKVDSAVRVILGGVQKNKRRIVLTKEAILFDRVKRLFPVWGNSWSYQQIRKSMKLEKVEGLMKN
jgi:short-subunit dehydrogenase